MKYLTFVYNIIKLKNHQVLKLKLPFIKHWRWIYSRGVLQDPPPGSDRVNPIPVKLWNDVNRQGRAIMARIEFLPQIE